MLNNKLVDAFYCQMLHLHGWPPDLNPHYGYSYRGAQTVGVYRRKFWDHRSEFFPEFTSVAMKEFGWRGTYEDYVNWCRVRLMELNNE